jgi:hypothetical protein
MVLWNMAKVLKGFRTIPALSTIIALLVLITIPHTSLASINTDVDNQDDSIIIAEHLKDSLNATGLVSVEQHTGRLLYNPRLDKLYSMEVKKQFLLPAMLVNQKQGLKLVSEMPFTCFTIDSGDLLNENYKDYRQYHTLEYIRTVKGFPATRALICQPAGKSAAKEWRRSLSLEIDAEPFVFEEHVTDNGDKFYYYLNNSGSFEMYF